MEETKEFSNKAYQKSNQPLGESEEMLLEDEDLILEDTKERANADECESDSETTTKNEDKHQELQVRSTQMILVPVLTKKKNCCYKV